jgi:hypothetical protein
MVSIELVSFIRYILPPCLPASTTLIRFRSPPPGFHCWQALRWAVGMGSGKGIDVSSKSNAFIGRLIGTFDFYRDGATSDLCIGEVIRYHDQFGEKFGRVISFDADTAFLMVQDEEGVDMVFVNRETGKIIR